MPLFASVGYDVYSISEHPDIAHRAWTHIALGLKVSRIIWRRGPEIPAALRLTYRDLAQFASWYAVPGGYVSSPQL